MMPLLFNIQDVLDFKWNQISFDIDSIEMRIDEENDEK
jgi:hypothetical protein